MEKTMTFREFLEAVINETASEEVKTVAAKELEKLNATNAKAAAKRAEKKAEDQPLINALKENLTSEPLTATEIGELIGCSTSKATVIAKILVSDGYAVAGEKKIKSRVVKTYCKAE